MFSTNLVIVISMMVGAILLGETAYHFGFPSYVTRKIVHISGALIAVLLPSLITLPTAVFIGIGFSFVLFLAKKLRFLPSLYMGNQESVGPSLFGVGLTLAALTFWNFQPFVYQMSCLILGFSDALAGIIGRTYGRIKYQLGTEKTIEGSLVFLFTTVGLFLAMAFYYKIPLDSFKLVKIALSSILLTFSESVFGNGWDNIILPFVSGLITIWALN